MSCDEDLSADDSGVQALSALPVASYYATLTLERYKQEKRQMAKIIIREIHPDYLTIENEPKTAQEHTAWSFTGATSAASGSRSTQNL